VWKWNFNNVIIGFYWWTYFKPGFHTVFSLIFDFIWCVTFLFNSFLLRVNVLAQSFQINLFGWYIILGPNFNKFLFIPSISKFCKLKLCFRICEP
jgi:hypothetical protein